MKIDDSILDWLLQGDVSIQYQVYRDLFNEERPDLRERIASEGWGARFLRLRKPDGNWGRTYYQPKWTSTHYTLLDLKNLLISSDQQEIRQTLRNVLEDEKGEDGGINPFRSINESDVCVNGMFLNVAAYFRMPEVSLRSIIDFLLHEHMDDGGFNCDSNRRRPVHSSLHSTISVLEGLREYIVAGYAYRLSEIAEAEAASREFILQHRLFRSDRTGEIIDRRMLLLSYPSRWHYDILRALDYFQAANVDYDTRMQDAIGILNKKRRADGKWPLQGKHPGKIHFEMEDSHQPSRWNTLRALRVLKYFKLLPG